jgi:hypothetical protein
MAASPEPFAIAVPEALLSDLQTMAVDGHFAALEEPQALVEDIWAFYRELR